MAEVLKVSEGKEEMAAEMINNTMAIVDMYVRKEYLSVIDQADVVPMPDWQEQIVPGSNMRLIKIDSFVFDKGQSISGKIRNIYGAIQQRGISSLLIINGKRDHVDFYLGVCSEEESKVTSAFRTYLNSFNGVFPGCRYENMKFSGTGDLLKELVPADEKISMAAVSCFPAVSEEQENYLEKIDVLIDGMRRKPFSMILLAQTIDRTELAVMRQGFESLYTQIYPFQKGDISISESGSVNLGVNFSNTISASMNISSGIGLGHTATKGVTKNIQNAPDNEEGKAHQAKLQLAGAAASIALNTLVPGAGASSGFLQSLFYGQALSNLFGSADNAMGIAPKPNTEQVTTGTHEDEADTKNIQINEGYGYNTSESKGLSLNHGKTQGKSAQVSYVNKSVSSLLENLDEQIKELTVLEREGAFRAAAYFIAGDRETAASAANLYRSIISSGRNMQSASPVYHWNTKETIDELAKYLVRGSHPVFSFNDTLELPDISVAQPIGLCDMPAYFCIPEKSLPGLMVTEHAAFARDVILNSGRSQETEERSVKIGCIYHMGREEGQTAVRLSMDDLTAHLFVSGATGVGKSNFCYELLDSLSEKNINIMVIEPAKGEYSKVFGGRENFHVYGTNPRQAPLLRINPFAFPEGVTTLEHMERLLAIFNTAWPMYSAMPAILKDALEEVYRKRGFDLLLDGGQDGLEFPCFDDLLEVLPRIIKSSEYSKEVQGNYIGALVTRVKSMTNGIYSLIFSREEIGDNGLFDENVIVDISRIGSEETKALLMGVLVMRLSEYRMCSGRMNSPLNHVTLIEEAHHLLKKQNASSGEGVNVRQASVEMITTAIAEMRTYGQGFIIADQSPSLMDPSVIGNTQTKVFFMLPRREDRIIAGDCVVLEERQQQELAKLPRGVAVVRQNSWTDAVLCKINHFPDRKMIPFSYKVPDLQASIRELTGQCLAILIKERITPEGKSSLDRNKLTEIDWTGIYVPENKKRLLKSIVEEYCTAGRVQKNLSQIGPILEQLVGFGEIFNSCKECMDMESWVMAVRQKVEEKAVLTADEMQLLISLGIQCKIPSEPEFRKLYVKYLVYCNDKGEQR